MGKKKEKSAGLSDERFSRIKSDPLFAGLKNTNKKVVIDKRFSAALTDERFSSRAKVDMRGKKQKKTLGNDMLDIYELEEGLEVPAKKTGKNKDKKVEQKKKKDEIDDFFDENQEDDDEEDDVGDEEADDEEEDGDDDDEDEAPKSIFKKLDLARGEGNAESSSDDETSSDEDEDDSDGEGGDSEWKKARKAMQLELDLANLDKDAEVVEWSSARIAICNLEWDHMHCEDILMLVKSFIPEGGRAVSVGIYLSEFGKEQLALEEKNGPAVRLAKPLEEYEDGELDPETKTAVREYLLNRLKYYYAVVEFDSEASALGVYEQCDGFQFEETGLKMDMRFVPDDMEFDKEGAREFLNADDVNLKKYKPKKKPKNVISSTNSKISWDEDDPSRSKKLLQAFEGNDKAGQELIVNSDESDGDEEKRDALMSLLRTEETGTKLDIEWSDDDEPSGKSKKLVGDAGDSDSDGEYVKIDDDDDEIGISAKRRNSDDGSDDDDEEKEEPSKEDEKLSGYKKFLKKKKAKIAEKKLTKRKGAPAETTIKSAEIVANVTKDDRFKALFTDSAFAIEPSSKKFKGSALAAHQAEHKADMSNKLKEKRKAPAQEDLVSKLKKKTEKWKSKK